MAEAGRRILLYQFETMLANEPGARAGSDPEAIHDMRVATRRMRAALQLIGDCYEPEALDPISSGLKRTGRRLGQVRDLDVLRINMEAYLEMLPAGRCHELDSVLWRWQRQHKKARQRMLSYLNSPDHQDFLTRMEPFVRTEGAGVRKQDKAGSAHHACIREIVPGLIHGHTQRVLAYGPDLERASMERLHALRIDIKSLRYTLEFFRSVLGKGVQSVISTAVSLQDHLGALNDAVMAQLYIQKSVAKAQRHAAKWARKGADEVQAFDYEGAEAYLTYLESVVAAGRLDLPGKWAALNLPETQKKLEKAVDGLRTQG